MTPELYEFMQTKLFGLIYALLIFSFSAWATYTAGYERGRYQQMKKQKVVFIALNRNGEVVAIDDEGKSYQVIPYKTEATNELPANSPRCHEKGSFPTGHRDNHA